MILRPHTAKANLTMGTLACLTTLASCSSGELIHGTAIRRLDEACATQEKGGDLVTTFTSTLGSDSLTLTTTSPTSGDRGTTSSLTMMVGGAAYLRTTATRTAAGGLRIDTLYGSAFSGIREAHFTSTDGVMLTGTIDGRAISPFRIGSEPSTLKLADGSPAPVITVDPTVEDAASALIDQAQADLDACSDPGANAPASLLRLRDTGHISSPQSSGDCKKCKLLCVGAMSVCAGLAVAAALKCGPFYPVCLASELVACGVAASKCVGVCKQVGGDCCPVSCGGSFCCDKAESCLDPMKGLCCSAGTVTCGGTHCCNPGSEACIGSSGTCCPLTREVCGSVCCADGEKCLSPAKSCCPSKQVCDTLCCKPLETCVTAVGAPTHCECKAPSHVCGVDCCPADKPCVGSPFGTMTCAP